jgi:hypothetical protein
MSDAPLTPKAQRFFDLYIEELSDAPTMRTIATAYKNIIALRQGTDFRTKRVERVCKRLGIGFTAHEICVWLNSVD